MVQKQKINLVIVDDHEMFLLGLKTVFQEEEKIRLVAAVSNSQLVMDILQTEPVDIVVSDLSMPEIDGISLNAQIKKKYPYIKTLILSTYNDPGKVDALIKSHVDGYVLKNAKPAVLLDAIYSLYRNEKYFAEEVKEKYMTKVFSNTDSVALSERETQVLKLITAEYTTTQIAYELSISEHTVNTHRRNLLFKLNVKNTAGLVKYALRHV